MLELRNISKTYLRSKHPAAKILENLNLKIQAGDFITIVGPSGAGKTTLLRIMAGLLPPSSGQTIFNGAPLLAPMPGIGLIPQDIFLFPWLTVRDNIAFGLKLKRITRTEQEKIIAETLHSVGLAEFADYYPDRLSRGMQQKIALARTIALDQELILMDEPFVSLDYRKKIEMQEFLHNLWRTKKKTIVLVTHDIEEAIYLSNKIFFLDQDPDSIDAPINVSLPLPRTFEQRGTEAFQELKNQLYAKLKTAS